MGMGIDGVPPPNKSFHSCFSQVKIAQLTSLAQVKGAQHPSLLLESSWRIGDWVTMKDVLSQADRIMPESSSHLVALYRGYLALQRDEDPGTQSMLTNN